MRENIAHLFGVTTENLRRLISIALEEGGEYADIFFEHTVINELSLRDDHVNKAGSHIDYGVGIRVVKGEETGYAYSEITTMAEMEKAARYAAKIAASKKSLALPLENRLMEGNDFYPIKKGWEEFGIREKLPLLELLNAKIHENDGRTSKVRAAIHDSLSKILFYNSLGETYSDIRPLISVMASCTMEQNGRRESAGASRSFRAGFEILDESLITELASSIVRKGAFLFDAKQPSGGEMPVVMGAGSSGILLHEAVGHAFEADFNRKRTSIFCDLLGKKVCNEHINVVDDGTVMFNRGAVNFDDEGVEGQKTYLVKDGILTSYLHDRISAKHYGVAPTGNGRRDTFRNTPIPRMRATYMEAGNLKEEDIIASVKKGIYVSNFTNGQVQIGAGDFTFFVKNGYLIEDGKLTQPIKDINIIGNGPKALADITMVADNPKIDNGAWTCGKDGQSCPVTCGMPSALVSKLTVGGE